MTWPRMSSHADAVTRALFFCAWVTDAVYCIVYIQSERDKTHLTRYKLSPEHSLPCGALRADTGSAVLLRYVSVGLLATTRSEASAHCQRRLESSIS